MEDFLSVRLCTAVSFHIRNSHRSRILKEHHKTLFIPIPDKVENL